MKNKKQATDSFSVTEESSSQYLPVPIAAFSSNSNQAFL
jgi:hypothetical protein